MPVRQSDPREVLANKTEDLTAYNKMSREQRMEYLRWRRDAIAIPQDPLNPSAGPKHDVRPSTWMAQQELAQTEEPWLLDEQILSEADRSINDVLSWEISISDEAEQLGQAIENHSYDQRDQIPQLKERLALRKRLLHQLKSGDVVERHRLFRVYRDARITPESIQAAGEAFLASKPGTDVVPYRRDFPRGGQK